MFKNSTVLARQAEAPSRPEGDGLAQTKRAVGTPGKRRQKGVAAVEFAVILPVLVTLLFVPVFFARVFMHYSVAEKAAHSAALYLSSIPRMEMGDQDKALDAVDIASQIVDITIDELNPGAGR